MQHNDLKSRAENRVQAYWFGKFGGSKSLSPGFWFVLAIFGTAVLVSFLMWSGPELDLHGKYGSKFSPDSINNPYGAGNPLGSGVNVYGNDD